MTNSNSPESLQLANCFEELEDRTRYLSTYYPRAEFVDLVHDLETPRVMRSVLGLPVGDPPLSILEDHLAAIAEKYPLSPGKVVGLLLELKKEVLSGQLFEEKPESESFPVNY